MKEEDEIARYESDTQRLGRRPSPSAGYDVTEMEDTLDLLTHLRVMYKRRWTILAIPFILFVAALAWTLLEEPVYRAEVLLEIKKEAPAIPTVAELFADRGVSNAYLETQHRILQSATLAQAVIEKLNLDEHPEFNPPSMEPDRNRQQATLDLFAQQTSTNLIRNSRLLQINFESHDPELAALIVNTLAESYIEQDMESRWKSAQQASQWLSQRLSDAKTRLDRSEEELQKYVREQDLQFLDAESSTENIVNRRLRQLQAELTDAEADRYKKESLYLLIQDGDKKALPRPEQDAVMEDLLAIQLAGLRRERATLTATASPDDVRVKRLQEQIDEIEGVLEQGQERIAAQIISDYRAAVRREDLVRKAFATEQERAREISERLPQYNILKREVETNRTLYAGLLDNLKQSIVAEDWKVSNISVVDKAETPRSPVRPRPLRNLTLAVVLGLGLGVVTAFFQEYLSTSHKGSVGAQPERPRTRVDSLSQVAK